MKVDLLRIDGPQFPFDIPSISYRCDILIYRQKGPIEAHHLDTLNGEMGAENK